MGLGPAHHRVAEAELDVLDLVLVVDVDVLAARLERHVAHHAAVLLRDGEREAQRLGLALATVEDPRELLVELVVDELEVRERDRAAERVLEQRPAERRHRQRHLVERRLAEQPAREPEQRGAARVAVRRA